MQLDVVTAVYILRVVGKLLYGKVQDPHHLELTDAVWHERFATIVLIAAVAAIGCFPNFFESIIKDTFTPGGIYDGILATIGQPLPWM